MAAANISHERLHSETQSSGNSSENICFVDPEENFPSSTYYRQPELKRPQPWQKTSRGVLDDQNEDMNLIPIDSEGNLPVETSSLKFGTWDGVFTSCFLNIMGVIL